VRHLLVYRSSSVGPRNKSASQISGVLEISSAGDKGISDSLATSSDIYGNARPGRILLYLIAWCIITTLPVTIFSLYFFEVENVQGVVYLEYGLCPTVQRVSYYRYYVFD